nr:hypothetical protein [Pandoravirus massiliensis]
MEVIVAASRRRRGLSDRGAPRSAAWSIDLTDVVGVDSPLTRKALARFATCVDFGPLGRPAGGAGGLGGGGSGAVLVHCARVWQAFLSVNQNGADAPPFYCARPIVVQFSDWSSFYLFFLKSTFYFPIPRGGAKDWMLMGSMGAHAAKANRIGPSFFLGFFLEREKNPPEADSGCPHRHRHHNLKKEI